MRIGLFCPTRAWPSRPLFFGVAALALLFATPLWAEEECMDCHDGAEDEVEFADGSKVVVGIDAKTWEASVHGGELSCSDCHHTINEYPHPTKPSEVMASVGDFQRNQAETCKRCHYAYYTRVLDGIHYKQHTEGSTKAPTCVGCHGAHEIRSLKGDPLEINHRCANCHTEIAEVYANSVHGRALVDHQDGDIPVCTDCHGAHDIADPNAASFHAESYQLCARCHGDEERMEKYGLNANVLTSYLEDFHGISNQLYAAGGGEPGRPMATCTDCHGIHDIQSFKNEGETVVVKQRVVEVCAKCHEGATPEFTDAWLSHYTPTFENAPLVWSIKWGYRILIPMIMLGLILHILLHLWRIRARR